MKSSTNYDYLIGKTVTECRDIKDLKFRVTVKDGKGVMVTQDVDPTRVNVAIDKNLVTKIIGLG